MGKLDAVGQTDRRTYIQAVRQNLTTFTDMILVSDVYVTVLETFYVFSSSCSVIPLTDL